MRILFAKDGMSIILQAGEAFCTTTVVVVGKDVLIEGTQHPAGEAGLEAIHVSILTYIIYTAY